MLAFSSSKLNFLFQKRLVLPAVLRVGVPRNRLQQPTAGRVGARGGRKSAGADRAALESDPEVRLEPYLGRANRGRQPRTLYKLAPAGARDLRHDEA
jgi:hypothetical protein